MEDRAVNYVRYHGDASFSPGGSFEDIVYCYKNYGMVPQEIMPGIQYGDSLPNHNELDAVAEAYVQAIGKGKQSKLTPVWKKGVTAIYDTYLGECPKEFTYKGKTYTPKTFADEVLGLNMDDYVSLTSYTHHPFYQQFSIEVQDNWRNALSYNLPIDELMEVMNNALKNGYSVCWDGDVSHNGFSHPSGLAILPTNNPEEMINAEIDKWTTLSAKDRERKMQSFESPVPEMKVDDNKRQFTFNNRQTTDDHLMHITGITKDQNGTKYYITKNSWGTERNRFGGYLNMSESFVKAKTYENIC